MSVLASSSVFIQGQVATVHWFQDPLTSTERLTYQRTVNLGKGTFSEVVKVTCQGREWALKKPLNEKGLEFIQKEAGLLIYLNQEEKKAGQEYFVQLVAFIVLENNIAMALLTLYQGGDLFSRVENSRQGLSLESASKITEQMLKALSFLKDRGILHRDIKPENIFMVGTDDAIRIGDFGFGVSKEDLKGSDQFAGSLDYQSPELLKAYRLDKLAEEPFDFPSDMWAAGCVAFAAFSNRSLCAVEAKSGWLEKLELQQQTVAANFDSNMDRIVARKGLRPSQVLTLFREVLKGMLTPDPVARLTPEAGKDRFLQSVSPVSITAGELA